jgi:hypothetical protein
LKALAFAVVVLPEWCFGSLPNHYGFLSGSRLSRSVLALRDLSATPFLNPTEDRLRRSSLGSSEIWRLLNCSLNPGCSPLLRLLLKAFLRRKVRDLENLLCLACLCLIAQKWKAGQRFRIR